MKALLIDPVAREVREVEWSQPGDIGVHVGGYIEVAYGWENGNVLYVDENGLQKPQRGFFVLADRNDDYPIAGKGLVVGTEHTDPETGDYLRTDDVAFTADEVRAKLKWMSRPEVDIWALIHALTPAMTITTERGTETLATIGEMFATMPKPDPYVDETCPERACDKCGKLYRGPAVYCSLLCTLADAGGDDGC